jgi:hypothetical protein
MVLTYPKPILGQEAICSDGLGRVVAFKDAFPDRWIQVSTYVHDRQCKWAPHNVQLIDPGYRHRATESEQEATTGLLRQYREACLAIVRARADAETVGLSAAMAHLEALEREIDAFLAIRSP